ncbi:MAG: glycosyltransferase family 2 protein [Lentisphaeria bacterium]|nr:glycosyltransferase family 2 protein [Lentisphaeria bacterium]
MKEISISIIIPVYNVEAYIERCFQSVISQTYRNYEIIFVDDCGTDKSAEILQTLIDEYKGLCSIKFIHHEQNRGLSAARNSGINYSKGDYILFVDSDDTLYPDALDILSAALSEHDYDVVCGRSLIHRENHSYLSSVPSLKCRKVALQAFFDCQSCVLGASACNSLYNRAFLDEHNLRFTEGILWEDALFNIEICCLTNKIIYLEQPTYNYLIRQGSIITSRTEKHFDDELKTVQLLENKMEQLGVLKDKNAICLLVFRRLRLLIISWEYGEKKQKEAFDFLRESCFRKEEFNSLFFKHKLLYIQSVMPKKVAWLYVKCFVWLYRTFLWRKS